MSVAPFHVYTIWSGTTPLYVGQTGCLRKRMRQHEVSGLSATATHVSLIGCNTRTAALQVEAHQIHKLRPAQNVRMNPRFEHLVDYFDPEVLALYGWHWPAPRRAINPLARSA